MSDPASEAPPHRRTGINAREFASVLVMLVVLAGLFAMVSPVSLSQFFQDQRESASVLSAHNLSTALFSSAIEHSNTYPIGTIPSSSTSMFQLLLNQNYLEDPWEIYLDGKGKRPYSGSKPPHLTPENVGWDYMEQQGNTPFAGTTPSDTPLLISTGLGPQILANGSNEVAVPSTAIWGSDGVTVAYLDQSSRFIRAHPGYASAAIIIPVPTQNPHHQEKLVPGTNSAPSPALITKSQNKATVTPVPQFPPAPTSPPAPVPASSNSKKKAVLKVVVIPTAQTKIVPTGPPVPMLKLTVPSYRTDGSSFITVQP